MNLAKQTTLILLASQIIWPASAVAQSQPKEETCEPIGRILKSSQQNLVGKLLCSGDQIVSQISSSFVLCYFNPSEQQCRPKKQPRNSSNKECPLPSSSFCNRRKGGNGTAQTPRIITPYGRMLLESRPTISWFPVPNGTKYQITVESQQKSLWSKTVSGTSIPFPPEQPELNSDDVYKISVVAYQDDTPTVADSSVYRLLKPTDVKDLQQKITLIRSLNLDPDREAFLDLNAAYLSKGVLNGSISALEDRVKAGSDHPEIFRVLAERYIDARLLDKARKQYLKAVQLAKSQNNRVSLEKAAEGLQALDQYQSQLPERKKGAQ